MGQEMRFKYMGYGHMTIIYFLFAKISLKRLDVKFCQGRKNPSASRKKISTPQIYCIICLAKKYLSSRQCNVVSNNLACFNKYSKYELENVHAYSSHFLN